MKNLLCIPAILLALNCFAQVAFEQGYFISNAGNKVECLIKNFDWRDNPSEFQYKLSNESEIKTHTVHTVEEFGIGVYLKYRKFIVKIDKSSETIGKLSDTRNPEFTDDTLFLKLLIEGNANLYSFEFNNQRRFFYNSPDHNIAQLVYKKYSVSTTKIGENFQFRQQLLLDLPCKDIKSSEISQMRFIRDELIKYFTRYNECVNSSYINYVKKDKRNLFHLGLRPGLNFSSLTIDNSVTDFTDTDFGKKTTMRMGAEFEFVLPYNKNKWAILIEPTYQYFKSTVQIEAQSASVDYSSIEIPIGVRHYFFLNPDSKIFLNAAYLLGVSRNSIIEFGKSDDLLIKARPSLVFGVGYNFKNKFCAELRFGAPREILGSYSFWDSKYRKFSIILGYYIL